jgi:hypothetical protein
LLSFKTVERIGDAVTPDNISARLSMRNQANPGLLSLSLDEPDISAPMRLDFSRLEATHSNDRHQDLKRRSHSAHSGFTRPFLATEDFTSILLKAGQAASFLNYSSHYRFIECIGAGNFGEVWKASHHRTGALFAVKQSRRPFRTSKELDRFLRELHAVARMDPHPNLVQYHRAWQDGGRCCIAMELCDGGTLQALLDAHAARRARPPPAAAARLCAGAAAGLAALHAAGLMHLDLKPDNIFLTAAGAAKIGDYGCCLPQAEWDEARYPLHPPFSQSKSQQPQR